MRKKGSVAILIILLLGLSLQAEGTVFRRFNLAGLVQTADAVVVGQVADIRYGQDESGVYTILHFRVERPLKGQFSGGVYLRVPGGVLQRDGRTLVTSVDGLPVPSRSDRAVLFLSGRPPGNFFLVGMEQGYRPISAASGSEDTVVDLAGNRLHLQEFLRQIETAVRGER